MQVSCILYLFVAQSHRAHRVFNPSWVAVAKAWSKVARSERDSHFFATLDFENSPEIFKKVTHTLTCKGLWLNIRLDGRTLRPSCTELCPCSRSSQVSQS
jgi:OST3 / OST6 family, transporter family